MNIALLPSLATAISEVPAKGLSGLVLRVKVHSLPCSKLREPGPGSPGSPGSGPCGLAGHSAGQGHTLHSCRRLPGLVGGLLGKGAAPASGGSVLSCLRLPVCTPGPLFRPLLTNPCRASAVVPAAALGLHPRASTPCAGNEPN